MQVFNDPGGRPFAQASAKVIVLVSSQAGVGRTTLVAALASAIKRAGGRTLALDLDPKNALCLHLGCGCPCPGIAQGAEVAGWHMAFSGFSGAFCLAYGQVSATQREAFEHSLEQDRDWLPRQLASLALGAQDTVLIDCQAGTSVYLDQALRMADIVIEVVQANAVPMQAQPTGRQPPTSSVGQPALKYHTLVNRLDTACQSSLDQCERLRQTAAGQWLGVIREDPLIALAQAREQSPLAHAPDAPAVRDIHRLAAVLCELLL